jgi:hypothetical protein
MINITIDIIIIIIRFCKNLIIPKQGTISPTQMVGRDGNNRSKPTAYKQNGWFLLWACWMGERRKSERGSLEFFFILKWRIKIVNPFLFASPSPFPARRHI